MKSQLPPEVLSQVWQLADKDVTGKFSLSHFIVAMWIITKMKLNILKEVPQYIPPSLWTSITSSNTLGETAPDFSTKSLPGTAGLSLPSVSFSAYTSDLMDTDRSQYSGYFDSLDTTSKGKLTGILETIDTKALNAPAYF